MNIINDRRLWFYPIVFGLLGAFLGLLIRFFFAQTTFGFPIKNLIHSHSHVMLLGFLFNALMVLIWKFFTKGIDTISYRYYIALQICVGGMFVAFIIQGYALLSILFSTLHLWIGYVFLIRLWKNVEGSKQLVSLVKLGIAFYFISSIGPYCLGPLMVFNLQESPWYQQAVFFYLHFQFFGAFLVWLLAVFLKNTSAQITKKHVWVIGLSIIGLYTHSLDYHFNHWLIQSIGGVSSALLLFVFISFAQSIKRFKKGYYYIYGVLLAVGICNVLGSFPQVVHLVETNHYLLIAWFHFLFLGLFVPFIWVELPIYISNSTWAVYGLFVVLSEALLVFPDAAYSLLKTSITWLLFIAYFGVFGSMSIVHLRYVRCLRNNARHSI